MIPGYSDIVRLPRLGKIRLGEKGISQSGKEYPRALDHFNFKDAPAVEAVYGAACKEIDVMFPCEDESKFFDPALRSYGKSRGLFCSSRDGLTAMRVRLGISDGTFGKTPKGQPFDPQGEEYIKRTGEDIAVGEMFEIPCQHLECPFYEHKLCRATTRLLVLLPKVDGFGCWEIDTTSRNGTINLQSYIAAIRAAAGRVSMIPIKLKLQPQEVQVEGKKKVVYVLVPVFEGNLMALLAYAKKLPAPAQVALPAPTIEDTPDDLMPRAGEALDERLGIKQPEVPKPEVAAAARARVGAQQPPQATAKQPVQPVAESEEMEGDGQEPDEPDVQPPQHQAQTQAAKPVTPTTTAPRKRPWG